jgi:hypothetical protein
LSYFRARQKKDGKNLKGLPRPYRLQKKESFFTLKPAFCPKAELIRISYELPPRQARLS